jgi:hypothetical protein
VSGQWRPPAEGYPRMTVSQARLGAGARLPSDRFRRPLYELLADPPLPGLDELLAVWREIIAAHPDAIGLWGGPAEDTGPVHGT